MRKLVSLVAAAMITTTAFADTASMSKDGLGDFLIAPVYFAKDNLCTNVTVYNTNETKSVIAKVAFREQIASNEVDFPIFLSPGDVWDGKVCQRGNGDVYLTSNDDSNHPAIKNLLLTGKDLTAQSKAAGHTNIDFTTGYIEVYPIAEFDEHSTNKVQKSVLVKRWDSLIAGKIPANTLRTGVDGYSLAGDVSFEQKNGDAQTAILPMVAFKGTDDKVLTGSVIAYGNDTSPSVLLGAQKKVQLLKLMQHKTSAFNYVNGGKDQYIVFTYPFGYTADQVRKFKVTVRDMEENKDAPKKQVVVFSPAPKVVQKANYMKNEVAVIKVSDLIAQTKNPAMYQKGQIQIKDITNVNNVQLGAGKNASFIATLVTIDNNKNGADVKNAFYTPVK